MSPTLDALHAALLACQEELSRTQARVADLERFLRTGTDATGRPTATLECAEILLRHPGSSGSAGLRLALDENGGGLLEIQAPDGAPPALRLGLDEEGCPLLSLLGQDGSPRAQLFIQDDCGYASTHGPEGRPGTLCRAQPKGGSVAVMQADGTARGVLLHLDENEEATPGGRTELLFGSSDESAVLRLRSDGECGLISVGGVDHPNGAVLLVKSGGASLLLRGQDEGSNVTLVAMEDMAHVSVGEGSLSTQEGGFSARMAASPAGSNVTLDGQSGEKAVDISSLDDASSLSMHDGDGVGRVLLIHHHGSHSVFSMQGPEQEEGLRAVTSAEVSSLELMSPSEPDTKILSAATADRPMIIIQKEKQALAMIGEGDGGGVLSAFGKSEGGAGIASLSGGTYAGSLVLAAPDGTPQMALDATDHGGRLTIHNDLGFPRAYLGVFQESAGLHLNHVGNVGLQALATPKGGTLLAFDTEGALTGSFPDEDANPPEWGSLPDNF